MAYKKRLLDYYHVSKPGIIRANLLTASAGYILASRWHIDWLQLSLLLIGLCLIIASACAANNYLDRGIDSRMQRTSKRALVSSALSTKQVIVYAAVTLVIGSLLLLLSQNILTSAIILVAWPAYVLLYGWVKRISVHGTLVGCISGSIPLVAGYTAITGTIGVVAVQLFILLTCWQMAHFYGIALYRLADYKSAKIPVMPAVYGVKSTEYQSIGYIILFIATGIWMGVGTSLTFIASAALVLVGAIWLLRTVSSLDLESAAWGRRNFLFSLLVMLGITLSLFANPLLPL